MICQITSAARFLGKALDFDELAKEGILKAVLRFAFFTLGAGLLLFGPILLRRLNRQRQVAEAVEQYVSGEAGGRGDITHITRNAMIARLAGLGLILLTFII